LPQGSENVIKTHYIELCLVYALCSHIADNVGVVVQSILMHTDSYQGSMLVIKKILHGELCSASVTVRIHRTKNIVCCT